MLVNINNRTLHLLLFLFLHLCFLLSKFSLFFLLLFSFSHASIQSARNNNCENKIIVKLSQKIEKKDLINGYWGNIPNCSNALYMTV